MISVRLGDPARSGTVAILRPVTTDWAAVSPATRRLELAAGEALRQQCEKLGELPLGSAVITGAGDLEAEFMVHAAVRARDEGVSAAGVRRALLNGLRRLAEWDLDSVAIMPFGTGPGGLEAEEAAAAMAAVLVEHGRTGASPAEVVVCVENAYEQEVFQTALDRSSADDAAGS